MFTGHCALLNGGFTPKKEAVILIFFNDTHNSIIFTDFMVANHANVSR